MDQGCFDSVLQDTDARYTEEDHTPQVTSWLTKAGSVPVPAGQP